MAIHPVGPLPASTYWLRRGALLLGIVVLLLVARSCVSGGEEPKRTGSTPTPSATPSRTVAPTQAAGTQPCPDAVLQVSPDTDAETYAVGGSPRLSVTVKNTGATPCTRDLGSGAVELLVFSGEDRVWSSDDCNPSTTKEVVTLAPGAQKSVGSITWAGKRSKPRCEGDRDQAKAGTYRLTARIGTLTEGEAVFRFRS